MHTHNINDGSFGVRGGSLMKILENKSPRVPPDCKGSSLQEKRAPLGNGGWGDTGEERKHQEIQFR